MIRIATTALALAASMPWLALAAPAARSCSAAEYRQLDFWLGDWDAYDASDPATVIARTRVDAIAAGCAVHELYLQTDGLVGDSILSFDAVRRSWQQTWVSNHGAFMFITGNLKDGALVLEGEMHAGDGRSMRQRITWKAEGRAVREYSVMSKDGGKSWVPAFDVLFRKHGVK